MSEGTFSDVAAHFMLKYIFIPCKFYVNFKRGCNVSFAKLWSGFEVSESEMSRVIEKGALWHWRIVQALIRACTFR